MATVATAPPSPSTVGITNQLISARTGTSGVDWGQAANVGKSLLLSPIVGFICTGLLLLVMKITVREKTLYDAPEGTAPPPAGSSRTASLCCPRSILRP